MKVKTSIHANKPMRECHVSFVIKDKSNSDKLLSGMSKEFDLVQENNDVVIQIPLALLVSDVYNLHVEILTFDQNGNSFTYDNPCFTFLFVIEEKNENYVWPKKYYGHVRIGDVETELNTGK